MSFLKTLIIAVLGLGVFVAHADYEVTITFKNGAERTVDNLVVQAGKVVLAKENLSVPFNQIKSAVFTFEEPLTLEECEGMVKRGEYKELLSQVNEFLAPVRQGLELPGNLDQYIQYKMRAGLWAKQYSETLAAASILEKKGSSYAPLAGLYKVLVLLEQGKSSDEVAGAFSAISDPDRISEPISEYIRGRLAIEKREYETALQHFSNIEVYHRRDAEWAPAAAYYEAVVYNRTGYLEAAANVVEEFKIAYADSYWGVRADELK